MFILSASQIRRADAFTILEEPVKSIDLMERAAGKCFEWFKKHVDKHNFIQIFCGPGNNGGDGLALARMLYGSGYEVKATLLQFDLALSMDCKLNLGRLQKIDQGMVHVVKDNFEFPQLPKTTFLIDAIFGTGLSRNIDGEIGTVITAMNSSSYPIISIDLPSGINSDNTTLSNDNKIVISNTTLTFQYPKLALLVSENAQFYGQVEVLDIGLSPNAIPESEVLNFQVDREMLISIYVPKREFSHKGNFGHGLLITGEKGKMGAAVLAAGGFLRSGGGLLTLLVPEEGIPIVQSVVPEAMVAIIKNEELLPADCNKFSAIGVGPGLGQDPKAVKRLKQLIDSYHKPIVFDADALNILSSHPDWLQQLPQGSLLTPHPGEFKRLVGEWHDDFEKLAKQRDFAIKFNVYLLLKGKNTSIACPDGKMYFNPTGNAGMAKGGSGDVLTGLLTGILASGYSPRETCILGAWLHGCAGDIAAKALSQEAMKAGDLVEHLGAAWQLLKEFRA